MLIYVSCVRILRSFQPSDDSSGFGERVGKRESRARTLLRLSCHKVGFYFNISQDFYKHIGLSCGYPIDFKTEVGYYLNYENKLNMEI